MNARDTAAGGPSAASVTPALAASRRRRRTALRRVSTALHDYSGTGVFLAMLMGCVALVALSR